jgi:dTDP-4-amino-4,6-dideoxygalactose transaminase
MTGNATTALMSACQLADESRPKVVVPATACINVLFAVRYAGRIPVLADIQPDNATVDPAVVADLIARDPQIGAVIAVHLYGHDADMDALLEICRSQDILLIEDAAQAQGGRFSDGSPLGSRGDIAVVSFGHTKILDAGGGGAVLTSEAGYASKLARVVEQIPLQASHVDSSMYSVRYYTAWDHSRQASGDRRLFHDLADEFKSLFVFSMEDDQRGKVAGKLPTLDIELSHRRKLHGLYASSLSDVAGVTLFDVDSERIAPWRFSFLVRPDARDLILGQLRSHGFHASNWYPCLRGMGREVCDIDPSSVQQAERLELEIINLWLTTAESEDDVRCQAELIRQVLLH